MSLFKIGDRVKFIDEDEAGDPNARNGDIGTVINITSPYNGPIIEIETDLGIKYGVLRHRLAKIESDWDE